MRPPHLSQFRISVEKKGNHKIAKASFPMRYGTYSEILTNDYEFIFNLNGEIKFVRGVRPDWPHPAEQLKRTDGNDWVYYSVGDKGGDEGVISWLGEYYLPCLPYPSNTLWEVPYTGNPAVMNAFAAWSQLYADLYCANKNGAHPRIRAFVETVILNNDQVLHQRAKQLEVITDGRISVLPPDTRHVDYEVIPLIIADGCSYHCRFCCVKSGHAFRTRSRTDIESQIERLKAHYGRNIENYHALFLGNHDALQAGDALIAYAALKAYDALGFGATSKVTPDLYLFGSVDALLDTREEAFQRMDRLPYRTCINVGCESVDDTTLSLIGKPLRAAKVRDAFSKMNDINDRFENIEITCNFILGDELPPGHDESLGELLESAFTGGRTKGAVYLSPLKDSPKKRELLPRLKAIKNKSRLPVFAYLIQRL